MKHKKRLLLGIGMLCLFAGLTIAPLSAQQEDFFVSNKQKKTRETIQKKQTTSKTTIPHYYKHHKKLPLTHSGIVIELTTSDLPLKRNFYLFKQFGNVYYDKLDI